MPRAIFFIKNSGRLMSIHLRLCFLLSSLLLPSTFTPCFPLSLPQLPSIPTSASLYPASASICPRPEPDLLLDTPDSPVAVLFPTTFPSSDTPFSALNRVSRAVSLSFVYVSCSDTPFPAQKPVSRAGLGWFVVSFRRAGVFLMPRHTLFGIKLCIASSFPVIKPCFVPRHTFFLTKVCIASKVMCLPPIFSSRYRFFPSKECVADRKHIP